RVALHRALYGHVMAGMRRHFVLRIDRVHLLVPFVHEHVLGAFLLDALRRTIGMLFAHALSPAMVIGNVPGPGAFRCHRQRCCEECYCHSSRKTDFHDFPLQKSSVVLGLPGRPVAWHSHGPVSRHFPNSYTAIPYMFIPGSASTKKWRLLWNPPLSVVLPGI